MMTLFNFGKKKEEKKVESACCGGNQKPEEKAEPACCCDNQEPEKKAESACCCGNQESEEKAESACCCDNQEPEEKVESACCCDNQDPETKTEPACCCGNQEPEKKAEPACACQGDAPEYVAEEGCCGGEEGGLKSIKVLGPGCKSCHELNEAALAAVKELNLDLDVEYITDMEKIISYGVMSMPALVVNEQILSMGKALKPAEIVALLRNRGFC